MVVNVKFSLSQRGYMAKFPLLNKTDSYVFELDVTRVLVALLLWSDLLCPQNPTRVCIYIYIWSPQSAPVSGYGPHKSCVLKNDTTLIFQTTTSQFMVYVKKKKQKKTFSSKNHFHQIRILSLFQTFDQISHSSPHKHTHTSSTTNTYSMYAYTQTHADMSEPHIIYIYIYA